MRKKHPLVKEADIYIQKRWKTKNFPAKENFYAQHLKGNTDASTFFITQVLRSSYTQELMILKCINLKRMNPMHEAFIDIGFQ